MIAKQMDVRSNMKKYFDMAYEGEIVIIPRKHDRNVVIISEEEYNRLSRASYLIPYGDSVSDTFIRKANYDMDRIRANNHNKLESIRSMGDNWNGNGAPAFSSTLIDMVHNLINNLEFQPEIFPSSLCTIQLEYDNVRRDHMEITVGLSDTTEIFILNNDGSEEYMNITTSPNAINEQIRLFLSSYRP